MMLCTSTPWRTWSRPACFPPLWKRSLNTSGLRSKVRLCSVWNGRPPAHDRVLSPPLPPFSLFVCAEGVFPHTAALEHLIRLYYIDVLGGSVRYAFELVPQPLGFVALHTLKVKHEVDSFFVVFAVADEVNRYLNSFESHAAIVPPQRPVFY